MPWSPFRAFAGPGLHRLLRVGSSAAVPIAPLASPVMRRFLPTNAFFHGSKRIRYIRDTTNRDAFMAMAADVANHDHRRYMKTLAALGRHDLRDELGSFRQPVMLLAGGKDFLVRPSAVKAIAARVPNAMARVVPQTSHFMHLEDVGAVNAYLEEFLESLRRG